MKNIFPGYNKKTEEEIKKLWEDGIIMFDANVLLNLYRYSNETRKTIVDLISKFKDKIWLPHQSALEYNKNRYEVIADQEKAYKEFTEKITQIQKDLQSNSKPPFLSKKVHKDLNKVFEKVSTEVEDSIEKYCGYLKSDPIYDELTELFENRISEPFDYEKLSELYKEGQERFDKKIPPGYEDEKNKQGNRKYGDFILWMQVIEKAKESKSPIIFITDERKKDWWWKIKDGRNMGPRQELTEEIKEKANVDFHMYSSERFLSYGQNFLEGQVNQVALEEIQAMKKAEIESLKRLKIKSDRNFKINIREKNKLRFLKEKQIELKDSIYKIDTHQNSLMRDGIDNSDIQEYIHNLSIKRAELESELSEISEKRNSLKRNEWESNDLRNYASQEDLFKMYMRNEKDDSDKNN
ncbi:MAG: hypothetical protein ACI8RP_001056 [Urechidicola sp.]|jgi:hypothetical protein